MSVRRPLQARGLQRYNHILDACAQLVVTSGLDFSMRDLSAAAATSIGSLYHFFPDKQSVVDALTQRHLTGVQTTARTIALTPDRDWIERPPLVVVECLLGPLLHYAAEHPDFIVLVRQKTLEHQENRKEVRGELLALYRRVLALRLPQFQDNDLDRYAYVLLQLPIGLIGEAVDEALHRRLLLEEGLRAVGAYLMALESAHARLPEQPGCGGSE